MLEAFGQEAVWLVVIGFLIAFALSFGVGANDVANSFGTSVGSKALTLKQACILATIFEILGALLMGFKVSDTVRKDIFDVSMYQGEEKILMMGNVAALSGSAVWNLAATYLRMPVSGTHGIVGAVLGFTLVVKGFRGIQWKTLGFIVASWFVSPLLSGLVSVSLFLFIRRFILSKGRPGDAALRLLPCFYGFTLFVNSLSVVHDGSPVLGLHLVPWWGALIISAVIGTTGALIAYFYLIPREKKLFREMDPLKGVQLASDFQRQGKEEEKQLTDETKEDPPTEEADDDPEIASIFKALQILTAIFGAFAHGGNDVSNAIAPLVGLWLIFANGSVDKDSGTPIWLLLYGGVGISAGLWIMGRNVIRTMGEDLTKITPSTGFTIEIGSATTVLLASKLGLPISTTHCKVGSVVAVGCAKPKGTGSVDLKLFRSIVLAWFVTLPVTAVLSALMMLILYAMVV